jgi:hypothetical protein
LTGGQSDQQTAHEALDVMGSGGTNAFPADLMTGSKMKKQRCEDFVNDYSKFL